jgi:MFS family permease
MLLVANLGLSLVLTVVTVVTRNSIVDYQLDHRHISDPTLRETLRHSYTYAILGRVFGNIVLSVVYAFLVRALFRGRRWAYRRVIWIAAAGIVALVLLQRSPYPPWMRAEQLIQAAVLAGLLYAVTRPGVRAYFAKGLPGRDVRRFRRS